MITLVPRIPSPPVAGMILVLALVAVGCGSTSEPDITVGEVAATETTATVEATAEPTAESSDGSGDDVLPPAALGFSWTEPDPFDATYGAGSQVLDLAAILPGQDDLPGEWQSFDTFEQDEAECAGQAPEAAIDTGWLSTPVDPAVSYPNIVGLRIEDHGSPERATAAASILGSDQWVECQAAVFAADQPNVTLTTDNPAGVAVASVLDHDDVAARRQQATVEAFGSEFELTGDTHVWTDGGLMYRLFASSAEGRHEEVAIELDRALRPHSESVEPASTGTIDRGISKLREAVERDEDALPFFEVVARSGFVGPDAWATQFCASETDTEPLAVMSGPAWTSPTGASLIVQGGLVFESATSAQAELDRYEQDGGQCLVEQSGELLGDFGTNGVTLERRVIDGFEVLVADASLTQLASNDFVADDIPVRAQQTIAVSDGVLVGFGFVGVDGDEPDLVQRTADALRRIAES